MCGGKIKTFMYVKDSDSLPPSRKTGKPNFRKDTGSRK